MRVPSLPIFIDQFPATGSLTRGCLLGAAEVFILTHFHTDHMKGLSSAWSTGLIVTSTLTKQLLLSKYDGLRGRVLGLPLWCRTPILSKVIHKRLDSHAVELEGTQSSPSTADGDAEEVYVTLLPAFHIPGSTMVYLETPRGVTYLHTGDFKYAAAAQQSPLRSFLQTHRVDHLFLDDTWLHLGQLEMTAQGRRLHPSDRHNSGMRVLSKLLDSAQVEEAIEAIGRRMDHQRLLFEQDGKRRGNTVEDGTAAGGASSRARQPFLIRVYLHNQFGKEMLIQQLALRLRTRAVIDDVRYARLLTVVEALEEERDDLDAFPTPSATMKAAHTSSVAGAGTHSEEPNTSCDSPAAPLSMEEQVWRSAGGEAAHYPYDLSCFVSYSQWHAQQQQQQQYRQAGHSCPPPLIEVVSTRAGISAAALQEASAAYGGTPYYAVVISGWARLQRPARGSPNSAPVWHIPTTLHCTPQEIIDFVAFVKPLSVMPLHYRPSRAAVVMQRLGPFLRTPFVNRHDTDVGCAETESEGNSPDSSASPTASSPWMPSIPSHMLTQIGHAAEGDEGELTASRAVASTRKDRRRAADLDALAPQPTHGFLIGPPLPFNRERGAEDDGCTRRVPVKHWSDFLLLSPAYFCTSPSDTNDGTRTTPPLDPEAPAALHYSADELLPSWRLRSLTDSYLNTQQGNEYTSIGDLKRSRSETVTSPHAAQQAMWEGKSEDKERAAEHNAAATESEGAESPSAKARSLANIADGLLFL